MARPLRVIFMDDSVYDCMLLVKELRHGGFEPRYTRVDNVQSLRAELGRGTWDVVVVDYGASALEAIGAARGHDASVPVIVISDVPGDEAAVAAMTAGARDFVLRDKLERLPPAVDRALQERQA